ncbi:MAG: cysteine protease StiP family protein [Butyricicoccus pullicaecorum]|nr:cysteine protease StiP family protein [Butyricicoccus pullicaecorum]MDO4669275.1 cysteine protease StiP family protein [Butyricicoccus pullicaecorum]
MNSSYRTEDVTLLLKDITGQVEPMSTREREIHIQAGVSYCEMLPREYVPSTKYLQAYQQALCNETDRTAAAVRICAERIYRDKGDKVVLVSLARAGVPIGILLKWYLRRRYGIEVPHYGISIIRGRGIDHNAMRYLLEHHAADSLQFVDGWIGKGAILTELQRELAVYSGVSAKLAVLSDPAGLTDLCGTHEDFLIPSSCLNCTVSGLISRTFLRGDIIGAPDFHGAAYYGELAAEDRSYEFLDAVAARFEGAPELPDIRLVHSGLEETQQIAKHFAIDDINLVKPGIGEATRVLLRRMPWKMLVREDMQNDPALAHLYQLAREKGISVEPYPLQNYKACGIIQQLRDV